MSRFDRMDKDSYVEVVNNTESTIGYITPDGRKSIWPAPTRRVREVRKRVRLTELYDAMGKPSVVKMLSEGALLIRDNEAREVLGLDPLDEYILDAKETEELLLEGSQEKMEEVLQYCSDAILNRIVDRAIELPLRDWSKIKLIESYSNRKVGDAIRAFEEDNHYKEEQDKVGTKLPEGGKVVRRRKVQE